MGKVSEQRVAREQNTSASSEKTTFSSGSQSSSLLNEIKELKDLLVQQTAYLAELEQRLMRAEQPELTPSNDSSRKAQIPGATLVRGSNSVPATSRRKMLKRLGLATVAGLAASGVATLTPSTFSGSTAQAASGDTLIIGNSNLASNSTYISQTNGTVNLSAFNNFNPILWADYNTNAQTSIPNLTSSLNIGVAGTSTGGIGGYFQGDHAPLMLAPSGVSNAPTGTHFTGELSVDSNGTLWYCSAGGSNPSWKMLSKDGVNSSSVVTMLQDPIRVVGPYNPDYNGSFPVLTGGTTTYYKMEGTWTNVIPGTGGGTTTATIPPTAIGVIGVITAWNATVTGLMQIYPPDVTIVPAIDSLYYIAAQFNTTGFVCRLGAISSGKPNAGKKGIAIAVNTNCTIAVDVFGYIN